MTTLKKMIEKNGAAFVGLPDFLEQNINDNSATLLKKFQADPKLKDMFDGATAKDLLTQFQQHVQAAKQRNRLTLKPGQDGARKLVEEFNYQPSVKPRPTGM